MQPKQLQMQLIWLTQLVPCELLEHAHGPFLVLQCQKQSLFAVSHPLLEIPYCWTHPGINLLAERRWEWPSVSEEWRRPNDGCSVPVILWYLKKSSGMIPSVGSSSSEYSAYANALYASRAYTRRCTCSNWWPCRASEIWGIGTPREEWCWGAITD